MKTISSAKTLILILLLSFIILSPHVLSETIDVNMEFFGPPWDINHEGVTNYLDASLIVGNYGETGPPDWIREDINDDGIVNYLDGSIFVGHYGETWLVIP